MGTSKKHKRESGRVPGTRAWRHAHTFALLQPLAAWRRNADRSTAWWPARNGSVSAADFCCRLSQLHGVLSG